MTMIRALFRDRAGASAVEFALAAPALLLFVIGMIQLGLLFSATAGMANGVNEAARYATIYPTPSDADILSKVSQKRFMVQSAYQTVSLSRGTANGVQYLDITMNYSAPLNFIFFSTPPVTLRQTRRVYLS